MNTDIWFPFYYGDYLKDTMQLSAERHGIYLLLMIHCWQNGYIEDDIETISIIAKVDQSNSSLNYILTKYFNKNENGYSHKRITKEKKLAEENKKMRSEKAKKAAGARWNKNATGNATSNKQALPVGMPESCPSSSSSSSSSKTPSAKYNPSDDLVFFNDIAFKEVWKDFISVRTKKKASKSDRAIKSIIIKLLQLSGGDKLTAIEIITRSADSGWSDIYEIKNKINTVETTEEELEAIWK